jgi:hypothetical protein
MDFLFVPGHESAENLGRQVIGLRPNTKTITLPPAKDHIAGLLANLGGASVTHPIGDILLVAHGLASGQYYIPLSATVGSPCDYEKAATADTANTIRLLPNLLQATATDPLQTITVRLRGCNIGRARPLLEKLQRAMRPTGGSVNLVAPLHFDEFHTIHGGWVEFLAHKFTVRVRKQFKDAAGKDDRPALLAAFDAAGFTYLDGTPIPTASWDPWVPASIHPSDADWRQQFDFSVDLNPAANSQTTVTIYREYRYEHLPVTWTWAAPDPGTDALRLDLLRTSLPQGTFNGVHMYDPSYDWPLYERIGFTSIDDLVNSLDWTFPYSGGTFHYRAVRHEYTVMLPITDPPAAPANPALKFYNFFPKAAASGPAVFNLDETNTDLFLNL